METKKMLEIVKNEIRYLAALRHTSYIEYLFKEAFFESDVFDRYFIINWDKYIDFKNWYYEIKKFTNEGLFKTCHQRQGFIDKYNRYRIFADVYHYDTFKELFYQDVSGFIDECVERVISIAEESVKDVICENIERVINHIKFKSEYYEVKVLEGELWNSISKNNTISKEEIINSLRNIKRMISEDAIKNKNNYEIRLFNNYAENRDDEIILLFKAHNRREKLTFKPI